MNDGIPRIRMFAGPNGSGKSTIKSVIHPRLLGVYVNPDDIELEIRNSGGFLDLSSYGLVATEAELMTFFRSSDLLKNSGLLEPVIKISVVETKINFSQISINSYFSSVISDFIRRKLLASGISFSFETVMSGPDKVDFLRLAQDGGYRTYLYYVATEDPDINISRVRHRVKMGGHDVPEDKMQV
jgi:predicted ABC-type ATPase